MRNIRIILVTTALVLLAIPAAAQEDALLECCPEGTIAARRLVAEGLPGVVECQLNACEDFAPCTEVYVNVACPFGPTEIPTASEAGLGLLALALLTLGVIRLHRRRL